MKIEIQASVHLHSVAESEINRKLDAILEHQGVLFRMLRESKERETIMAGELEAVGTEVAGITTAVGSMFVLVDGMAANILALKNDPVKLTEYANTLKTTKESIVAKVFQNTEVVPEPPPVVEASLRAAGK